MKKILKILFVTFAVIVTTLSFAPQAYGQIFPGLEGDDKTQTELGVEEAKEALEGTGITHTETLSDLVIKYVNFVLPYLALAAFVGFIAAGFMYVTAYGNEEQVQKAKKILIWSVVGLLLVIASFSITQFLTKELVEFVGE